MPYLFLTLILLIPIVLIIGLIKPSLLQKVFKKVPSRKSFTIACVSALFVSFIGLGITAPDTTQKKEVDITSNTTAQEPISQPSTESAISTKTAESDTVVDVTPQAVDATVDSKESPRVDIPYVYYSVSSVIDGDTVKVSVDGSVHTYRLIGMDTPETVDPRKTVQCFGKEASNKAKELLVGQKVRIEKDPTQGDLDKYGRTLAYIYLQDGLFYNKYMIEQGYAHEYTYDVPYKYQPEFKAAQKAAEANQRGLWSPATCNGDTKTPASTPAIVPVVTPPPAPADVPATSSASDGHVWYTSSYGSSEFYYCETDPGWKSLSSKYLQTFNSQEALLAKYKRVLHKACTQ